MVGIYKIENELNGHVYIGQSKNIKKRWRTHKAIAFKEGTASYEYPLYRAFRKYGLENFSFIVLEECRVGDLNARERYFVHLYNSFQNGYNQTLGGDSHTYDGNKPAVLGIIHDLETTDDLQQVIAKRYGVSEDMVQGINTGRYWYDDYRDYPIREQHHRPKRTCAVCGNPIWYKSKLCPECERLRRIVPLDQMPVTRKELKALIHTESFCQIGREYGVSDNAVRKWCIKFGLPTHSREIKKYTDKEWKAI